MSQVDPRTPMNLLKGPHLRNLLIKMDIWLHLQKIRCTTIQSWGSDCNRSLSEKVYPTSKLAPYILAILKS